MVASKKAEAKGPEDGLELDLSQGAGAERPLSYRIQEGKVQVQDGLGIQISPLIKGLRVYWAQAGVERFLPSWQ